MKKSYKLDLVTKRKIITWHEAGFTIEEMHRILRIPKLILAKAIEVKKPKAEYIKNKPEAEMRVIFEPVTPAELSQSEKVLLRKSYLSSKDPVKINRFYRNINPIL